MTLLETWKDRDRGNIMKGGKGIHRRGHQAILKFGLGAENYCL
jgi:hypothetical protein